MRVSDAPNLRPFLVWSLWTDRSEMMIARPLYARDVESALAFVHACGWSAGCGRSSRYLGLHVQPIGGVA